MSKTRDQEEGTSEENGDRLVVSEIEAIDPVELRCGISIGEDEAE